MNKTLTFVVGLLLAVSAPIFANAQTYVNIDDSMGTELTGATVPNSGGKTYCTMNAGRGTGTLYQCGNFKCAKNDAQYTRECVVNYRECTANGGAGYGTEFKCWDNGKMCAKTIPSAPNDAYKMCVKKAVVQGTGTATTNPGNVAVQAGFDKLENPLGGAGITSVAGAIEKILNVVLRIAIPFVTLMLIYTGFLFVKAQGDPGKLKEAKNTFVSVIIGASLLLGCAIIANGIANTVEKIGKSAAGATTNDTNPVDDTKPIGQERPEIDDQLPPPGNPGTGNQGNGNGNQPQNPIQLTFKRGTPFVQNIMGDNGAGEATRNLIFKIDVTKVGDLVNPIGISSRFYFFEQGSQVRPSPMEITPESGTLTFANGNTETITLDYLTSANFLFVGRHIEFEIFDTATGTTLANYAYDIQ